MNPLPTGPLLTKKERDTYFKDMKRWNFDIAYNAFYSYPYSEVIGKFKQPYIDFVKETHQRNLIACVQIQSTVAYLDDIPLSEGQLYPDGSPHLYQHYAEYGRKNFFASFCSKAWLQYLEKLTRIFVQEYGYDWIVFEEPMWITDIPGKNDLFYKEFTKRYPNTPYPNKHLETPGYVAVQKMKQDILVEFYDKLTTSARKIGAKKIGIMPWFFTPTNENTPAETFHSPCPTGRIIMLDNLDFVVVRIQPDNILAGAMTDNTQEALPQLYYLETMAHSLGKPVIVVNNPTNEHPTKEHPNERLIPLDYFTRCILSGAASAPQGMTRHWYKKHYSQDLKHMKVMTDINEILPRLGNPISDIAFVHNFRAYWHTLPLKTFEVWKNYWTFAQELFFPWTSNTSKNKLSVPFLTFDSETIEKCLQNNPNVQILVLNEYFPLSEKEIKVIEKWWYEKQGRTLLYFGVGNGYSTDETNPGEAHHTPKILRLFGMDTHHFVELYPTDMGLSIEFTGKIQSDDFLNNKNISTQKIGKFFVYTHKGKVLYQDTESKLPVVVESRNTINNKALFLNVSLMNTSTQEIIRPTLDYLQINHDSEPTIIQTSQGILWNKTKLGYLIASNLSSQEGYLVVSKDNQELWDIRKQEWINPLDDTILIPSLDFRLFRMVNKKDNLIDIWGMSTIYDIKNSANKIILHIFSQQNIFALMKKKPRTIIVNDQKVIIKSKPFKKMFISDIPCITGDNNISIQF